MNPHGKRRFAVLVVALAIVCSSGAVVYRYWWAPRQRLSDPRWMESASDAERLQTAHEVLRAPFGDHHDAFLIVDELGGPESVPYLLAALRWQPNTEPDEPMICTKTHCLKALRRITGRDAGRNYSDWAKWWESVGQRVPPSATTSTGRATR